MTDLRSRAIELQCKACGAALPIELANREITCAFCGERQLLDRDQVERVKRHFDALADFERSTVLAESEAQQIRRRSQGGVLFLRMLIGAAACLVGLELLLAILNAGRGPALTLRGEWLTLVLVVGIVVGGAALRRIESSVPAGYDLALAVGRAKCSGCGASIPVFGDALLRCPFCLAALLPDAASMERAAAAARSLAEQAKEDLEDQLFIESTEQPDALLDEVLPPSERNLKRGS